MSGASESSGVNSCGRRAPVCGHHLPMRIFVSKSRSNPGRRYWKCKYWGKENDCNGFHWDDEIESGKVEENLYDGVSSGSEKMLEVMRNYGAEFGKTFVDELGKSLNNKKIDKLKQESAKDQKTINVLTFTLIASWICFSVMLTLCNIVK
ncbi:uncharacterized protein LOC131597711 [Vicia villosa]|uniref:uncharacterized protein LOC131597711 n=1 Tax=Vicia villosa TaxID=3911 RepID=UPI00273A8090|nr:uncharacterized protein LOC131597711 [Vicia villosa]